MLYTQYKDAALKHLNACKIALHGLKFHHGNTPLSQKKREALLHNIFYLSGYTLECVINYTIYKRIGWNADVYTLIDSNYEIAFHQPRKDKSGKYIPVFDVKTRKYFVPKYWIAQHRFNRNIGLLSDIFKTLLPGTEIILINNLRGISTKNQEMILEKVGSTKNSKFWKPEIRYQTSLAFTQSEIEDLVQLTEQVYIQLLTVA